MNFRALVLGVSLFGVACGAENGNDDPASAPAITTVDRATFVREACASFAHCCKGPSICEKTFEEKLGTRTFDPVLGGACLATLKKSTACWGDFEFGFGARLAPCSALLAPMGKKQPGEACASSQECAASPEGQVECVHEQCQLQILGKVGDDCIGVLDGMVSAVTVTPKTSKARVHLCSSDNSYCDPKTETCQPLLAKGEECRAYLSCGPDTFCSEAHRCEASSAEGAPCDSFRRNCVTGTYCDSKTNHCTKQLEDGEKCSFSYGACRSGLCWNGVCGGSPLVDDICAP